MTRLEVGADNPNRESPLRQHEFKTPGPVCFLEKSTVINIYRRVIDSDRRRRAGRTR